MIPYAISLKQPAFTPMRWLCAYCMTSCFEHSVAGPRLGILHCESCAPQALRDCRKHMHDNKTVLLRDAIDAIPELQQVYDMHFLLQLVRSNGSLDSGWSIANCDDGFACDPLHDESQFIVHIDGEWRVSMYKPAGGSTLRKTVALTEMGRCNVAVAALLPRILAALEGGVYTQHATEYDGDVDA